MIDFRLSEGKRGEGRRGEGTGEERAVCLRILPPNLNCVGRINNIYNNFGHAGVLLVIMKIRMCKCNIKYSKKQAYYLLIRSSNVSYKATVSIMLKKT